MEHKTLSNIGKSAHVGKFNFSTREDYEKYFLHSGIVNNQDQIWSNAELVSMVHRHWHGEGRNGCIFALLSARKAEELGWYDYVIIEPKIAQDNDELKRNIQGKILEAIQNPSCEIISLLFSNVTTDKELVDLIHTLLSIDCIELVKEGFLDNKVTLALRVALSNKNVLSWLMAFGPFDYFPQTRQSPITEIAIRVKIKPLIQFYRQNNDRESAHLADLPIRYDYILQEKIWQNTLKRTRIILGAEPNVFSAARTTFTLRQEIWA